MIFIKRDKSLQLAILSSQSVFTVINLHLELGDALKKAPLIIPAD